MYESSPRHNSPLRQCEILSGLQQVTLEIDSVGNDREPVVRFEIHEYTLLLTQDCDLDLDYKARSGDVADDKIVPDMLFCEAEQSNHMRGSHQINSEIWRRIQSHNHERYQLLPEVPSDKDRIGRGVPALGLDFKRIFTIPTEEVYRRIMLGQTLRRSRMTSPDREHLINRFTRFQGRVALP